MNTLRKLFGPSRAEIWRQLCTETGADYVQGGFWKGDKVQAAHEEWTITLDTYAVSTGETTMVFTRLRAPYINPDHFRFTIYRRGLFSDIAKWLGMQDIEVGHEEFDRDFIIKGTEEGKLRALFENPRLRDLIAAQPQIHLTVKDDEGCWGADFPADTDELRRSDIDFWSKGGARGRCAGGNRSTARHTRGGRQRDTYSAQTQK